MDADSPIEELTRLTGTQRAGLKKLRIATIRDLFYHFPARYESSADIKKVSETARGDAVLYGRFSKLEMKRSWKSKVPMAEGSFEDDTGSIRVVWFHQPYLAKMVPTGALVRLRGKVTEKNGKKYIANPVVEKAEGASFMSVTSGVFSVYPETAGVTSLWVYHTLKRAIEVGVLETLEDPLPPEILKTYHLPALKSALIWIHEPKKEKDAEVARKRFAFEEVFLIQIARGIEREKNKKKRAYEIDADEARVAAFLKSFPFEATAGQKKAIGEILADFLEPHPMARLLEGDVGSGKTAVAAASAYAVVTSRPTNEKGARQTFGNLQVAYMCPTEILAKQHFATFTSFFRTHPIQIGLITSSGCYKFPSKTRNYAERTRNIADGWITEISRAQLLKWVANGEIPILIGTHALIQKSVRFKHLAYVIIDEQHKFGTAQRFALAKGKNAEQTRNKNDSQPVSPLVYRDLTYRIRTALFNVKKTLGSGHKEVVYQRAVAEEFKHLKIPFSQETRIPVMYRNKPVGTYIPDFVTEDRVIVELKALPFVGPREKKQLWSYLKGSAYRLALLANFGPQELTIDRVIYDLSRSASVPRDSAYVPHSSDPHLLSMTATPIPRTLALTLYGDLDLTVLDEMPAGRKPIQTEIVTSSRRDATYEKIRELLREGRQAYVICPRIDEPDPTKALALQARSVAVETKRLQMKIFPEYTVEKLHSKMTPKEKEETMAAFEKNEVHILVATSVVEVGVNVPNATVIMIEGAERFGLAQLHQLRGRVMRSTYQPYCFLMVDKGSGDTARLKAIVSAKNGFELAEKDLEIRGAGELYGRKQWGLSDIGMDALKNLKLVEAARAEAGKLVEKDPSLSAHPLLKKLSEQKVNELHFE